MSEKTEVNSFSLILMLILSLALDVVDIVGLGLLSLIVGIPGNALLALIAFFTPGMEKQLYGTFGLALAIECVPVLSIMPARTGTLLYLNMNKVSGVLGVAEKIAKYAKYVVGPEAAGIERALHTARQATQTVQAAQAGDLRSAYLRAAHLKDKGLRSQELQPQQKPQPQPDSQPTA